MKMEFVGWSLMLDEEDLERAHLKGARGISRAFGLSEPTEERTPISPSRSTSSLPMVCHLAPCTIAEARLTRRRKRKRTR